MGPIAGGLSGIGLVAGTGIIGGVLTGLAVSMAADPPRSVHGTGGPGVAILAVGGIGLSASAFAGYTALKFSSVGNLPGPKAWTVAAMGAAALGIAGGAYLGHRISASAD